MADDADLREYRDKRRTSGRRPSPPPSPADPVAGRRAALRGAAPRRPRAALRPAAGGGRRAGLVGGAQGARRCARASKRLAVRTEDHPLEYLTFAGGDPGGPVRRRAHDGLGHRHLRPRSCAPTTSGSSCWTGGILRGHYHLVRTGRRGGKDEWLLFRSGKGPPGPAGPGRALARDLRPMLASTADAAFDDPELGLRAEVGRLPGPRAGHLGRHRSCAAAPARTSRAATPISATCAGALLCQEAVLDGEVVVLDADGTPDFGALQAGRGAVHLRRLRPAVRGRRVDRGPPLARAPRAPGRGRRPRGAAAC